MEVHHPAAPPADAPAEAPPAGRGRGRGRGRGAARGRGRGRGRAAAGPPPEAEQPQEEDTPEARRGRALALLLEQGVPRPQAERAVEATEAAAGGADDAAWAEDALLWVAQENEVDEEKQRLAAAMEVSLAEAEARKSGDTPAEAWDAARAAAEFAASALLPALAARGAPLAALRASASAWPPALAVLQLEKKCLRWYDVSRHFFAAAGAELAAGGGGGGDGGGAEAPPAKRARLDADAGADAAQAEQAQAAAALPDWADALLPGRLERLLERVQAAVFSMPTDDGDRVPELFLAAAPAGEWRQVISLSDDDDGGGDGGGGGGEEKDGGGSAGGGAG